MKAPKKHRHILYAAGGTPISTRWVCSVCGKKWNVSIETDILRPAA